MNRRSNEQPEPTPGDERSGTRRPVTRRDVLRGGGVALFASLAGCPSAIRRDGSVPTSGVLTTPTPSSGSPDDPTPSSDDARTPTPADDPTPTATEPRTDWYVSPDGNDANTGTRSAPLGTLQAALSRVGPGHTVFLEDGRHYAPRAVSVQGLAGTRDRPITVCAVAGTTPVLDFVDAVTGGMRFSDCHWLALRGFTVTLAPSVGLLIDDGSSDVLVEDVTVRESGGDRDASGAGVSVYESSRVTLRNVVSRNNYDPGHGGSHADGIAVEASPGTVLESCVAAGNSDDGFDLWQTSGVTLRECRAFDNGWTAEGAAGGDGNGFKLGGGTDSGENVVERCVAFDNRERGFDDNSATRPLTLVHCTAWRNPVNFRLGCHTSLPPRCPAHRLRNNLSENGRVALSPLVDAAVNSWGRGIDDARFASRDRDDPAFLHLSADSPAIDAGVDLGRPYSGAAPDLGAFESILDRAGTGTKP